MKQQVRLLAIDIDGTLLNSHQQISPETLAALQKAHASGLKILLVTGRRHTFALPIARQLGFDLCLISSNGAVTRTLSGESFHIDLMSAELARRVCGHLRDFHDCMVVTFDKEEPGALALEHKHNLEASLARWIEKNKDHIQWVTPIESCLTSNPLQLMVCGTVEAMRPAEALLIESSSRDEITLLKTEYVARDLCFLDILSASCSKGAAVSRFADRFGIDRAEIMAIGDNFNDIEMLEVAGYPVVMGNASALMKRTGWLVTRTNDEHGVAYAVEAIFSGGLEGLS